MIFLYFFEEKKDYIEETQKIFENIQENKNDAVTSVITLLEASVLPFSINKRERAFKYLHLLLTMPNLLVNNVDPNVALKAAELRAKYRIKTPDAIQLATAILGNATGFITNDKKLKAVKELDIFILG